MKSSKRNLSNCKSYCSENGKDIVVSCFKEVNEHGNKKEIFIRLKDADRGAEIEISSTSQKDIKETHIGHKGTVTYRFYLSEKYDLFLFGEKKNKKTAQTGDIGSASNNLKNWQERKGLKRDNPLSESLIEVLRRDESFAKFLLNHISFGEYWCMKTEIDKIFFPEKEKSALYSKKIQDSCESTESAMDLRCKKCKASEPINEKLFINALDYKFLDKTLVSEFKLNEENWKIKAVGFDFGVKVFFLYSHTKFPIDFCKAIILGNEKMTAILDDEKKAADFKKIVAEWFCEKKYKCPKCKAHKNKYTGNNWECFSEEFE